MLIQVRFISLISTDVYQSLSVRKSIFSWNNVDEPISEIITLIFCTKVREVLAYGK